MEVSYLWFYVSFESVYTQRGTERKEDISDAAVYNRVLYLVLNVLHGE